MQREKEKELRKRNKTEPKGQEFSSIKGKDMDMKLTAENLQQMEQGKIAFSPAELQ